MVWSSNVDITRTIPNSQSIDWIRRHFDGRRTWADFPLPGIPRNLMPGEHLYLIYRGLVVGRFEIQAILRADEVAEVGTEDQTINAKCRIRVRCGGGERDRAPTEIRARGHT